MKKMLALLLLILLPAPLLAQLPPGAHSRPLVFTHVTVIDATGAPARPDMTVIIDGGRITEINRQAALPEDAQVINAAGKYLIPGLWDMHVHTPTREFVMLYVANGVTGVRDMFSPLPQINQWRGQILSGALAGPHIIAAGPIVDGPKPIWPGSIAVGNEAEGRKAVQTVKSGGSDFVKVYSQLSRDAYFAIADEAKKQGIAFAGHVPTVVTVAEASDAGQKSVEHLTGITLGCSSAEAELMKEMKEKSEAEPGAFLPTWVRLQSRSLATYDSARAEALFARLAKNGTWQTPTFTVLRALAFLDDPAFTGDPRMKYMPPFVRSFWNPKNSPTMKQLTAEDFASQKKLFARQLEMVGAMQRAGVGILAGTDTLNPYVFPGFSLHDELGLLVKAGLTPMQALQAATRNPAKYLDKLDSVGTVEKGKLADLVLLDADPLADISNTKKIAAVIVGGRLLDRAALDRMLAEVEAAANKQ